MNVLKHFISNFIDQFFFLSLNMDGDDIPELIYYTYSDGTHFSTGRYLQMKPFTDSSLLYHPEDAVQETTYDLYDTWIEWNNEDQQ